MALASVTVLAAAALAEVINRGLGYDGLVSFILVAIVLGMIIRNTVGLHEAFEPGVAFTLKKVLRLGCSPTRGRSGPASSCAWCSKRTARPGARLQQE